MKTHEWHDELLTAYLDGELSAAERSRVESRLASDPAAAALLDELRRTSAAIRALPRGQAPRGLAQAVRVGLERSALLNDAHDVKSRQPPRWRGLAYAAIVLLTCTVGYVALRPHWRSASGGGFARHAPEAGRSAERLPVMPEAFASKSPRSFDAKAGAKLSDAAEGREQSVAMLKQVKPFAQPEAPAGMSESARQPAQLAEAPVQTRLRADLGVPIAAGESGAIDAAGPDQTTPSDANRMLVACSDAWSQRSVETEFRNQAAVMNVAEVTVAPPPEAEMQLGFTNVGSPTQMVFEGDADALLTMVGNVCLAPTVKNAQVQLEWAGNKSDGVDAAISQIASLNDELGQTLKDGASRNSDQKPSERINENAAGRRVEEYPEREKLKQLGYLGDPEEGEENTTDDDATGRLQASKDARTRTGDGDRTQRKPHTKSDKAPPPERKLSLGGGGEDDAADDENLDQDLDEHGEKLGRGRAGQTRKKEQEQRAGDKFKQTVAATQPADQSGRVAQRGVPARAFGKEGTFRRADEPLANRKSRLLVTIQGPEARPSSAPATGKTLQ